MTLKNLQRRLMALGFPLPKFGADGDFGNETLQAVSKALDEIESIRAPKPENKPQASGPLSGGGGGEGGGQGAWTRSVVVVVAGTSGPLSGGGGGEGG